MDFDLRIYHGGEQVWLRRLNENLATPTTREAVEEVHGADRIAGLYQATYDLLLENKPDPDAEEEYALAQVIGTQFRIGYFASYGGELDDE